VLMSEQNKGCAEMKPIIGVMPLWDDEKESIWMLPGYMDGIQYAGGIPVVLSFSTDEAERAHHLWGRLPLGSHAGVACQVVLTTSGVACRGRMPMDPHQFTAFQCIDYAGIII
jgi:hypothetical protein